MKVLFAGSPVVAVPSLNALASAGHTIVAVATNPDARAGRGRELVPSEVAVAAAQLGVPVLKPVRARDPEFIRAVRELAPDVAVVVAWGSLIPDELLMIPQHGWVNAHFSLLPSYRGAAPVQRALIAGEQITGVTTFRLVREMDAGAVYRRRTVEIEPTDTAGTLLSRLADIGAEELVETLTDIAAGVEPTPQPDTGISFAPKLHVDDVRIDWALPARRIEGLVRGANPNPGAWTTLRGDRLKVLQATVADNLIDAKSPEAMPAFGELLPTKQNLYVGCGDGSVLRLIEVQAVGKKPMAGPDWARGARVEAGEHLE